MKKKHSDFFLKKWINPVVNLSNLKSIVPKYLKFIRDWRKYSHMKDAEKLSLKHSKPLLFDDTVKSSYDSHYFYQDIWAFKRILKLESNSHIVIGTKGYYVGFISSITQVTFVDIRPLITN